MFFYAYVHIVNKLPYINPLTGNENLELSTRNSLLKFYEYLLYLNVFTMQPIDAILESNVKDKRDNRGLKSTQN